MSCFGCKNGTFGYTFCIVSSTVYASCTPNTCYLYVESLFTTQFAHFKMSKMGPMWCNVCGIVLCKHWFGIAMCGIWYSFTVIWLFYNVSDWFPVAIIINSCQMGSGECFGGVFFYLFFTKTYAAALLKTVPLWCSHPCWTWFHLPLPLPCIVEVIPWVYYGKHNFKWKNYTRWNNTTWHNYKIEEKKIINSSTNLTQTWSTMVFNP